MTTNMRKEFLALHTLQEKAVALAASKTLPKSKRDLALKASLHLARWGFNVDESVNLKVVADVKAALAVVEGR